MAAAHFVDETARGCRWRREVVRGEFRRHSLTKKYDTRAAMLTLRVALCAHLLGVIILSPRNRVAAQLPLSKTLANECQLCRAASCLLHDLVRR